MIVYTAESKLLLITILISVIVNYAQLGLDCPSYKPYKSGVGCVAKCPKDFVRNGSSCIITCGNWFTNKNRECQPECKEGYFIRENLKAIGWYPYLEKECTDACALSELVFNQTCLETCPADYNYFVNYTCLQKCPIDSFYLMNITKSNGIKHHKCVKTCPYFEDDNYCVDSCPGKIQFNSKCVNTCPKSSKFVDGNKCVEQCPFERKLNANKTCVSKCPNHMSFIDNSTCVANCSRSTPLVESLSNGSKICVDTCRNESRNQFILNNECLSKCPSFTYNKTCLDKCPNTHSIINNVTIGRNCRVGHLCTELFYYNTCVDKCPIQKFFLSHENVCVDMCPVNTVLKNRTCLRSCDENTPYSEETNVDVFYWETQSKIIDWHYIKVWINVSKQQSIFQCLNDCSNGSLYLNYTCVDACPMETELQDPFDVPWNLTSRYLRYGRTCVNECPLDRSFIGITYVKHRESPCRSQKCNAFTNYFTCLSKCPENTYSFKDMCLSHCPSFVFDIGNVCVEKCPSIRHLRTFREIFIDSIAFGDPTKLSMFECVATCETNLVSNNTCVIFCPANNPYIEGNLCHNKTCNKMYELQTSKGVVCVTECPTGTLVNLNKCSTSCSKGSSLHNKSCLKTCPSIYPYRSETVMTKKNWKIKENKGWFAQNIPVVGHMCQKACLPDQVVDSSLKCVNNCPIKERYLDGIFCHNKTCGIKYENKTTKGIACLDKCPNGTVHFMNTCVKQCPEKYKFILNFTCVEECPSSYKFVLNSSVNMFSLSSVLHFINGVMEQSKELTCLSECPDWTLQHGNICTANCPEDLEYEFESKCVSACPSSSLLVIDTITDLLDSTHGQISKFRCLSKCEKNKIYKQDEKRCIYSFSCKYPYVEFHSKCLIHCPKGFKWFNGCFHVLSAIISVICVTLLLILYVLYCWVLFKETYYLIGKCCQYTKHDQNIIKPKILWQHKEEEGLNLRFESEDIFAEICADTLSLYASNKSNRTKYSEEETKV